MNLEHYNCNFGSIMRFHRINRKLWSNIVLNIYRLPLLVAKDNLTSNHVYSYTIVLKEVTRNINVTIFHKVVPMDIYPRMKFASLSEGFLEPAEIVFNKPSNPYYIILQKLKQISGYSSVEHIIYWNSYNIEVLVGFKSTLFQVGIFLCLFLSIILYSDCSFNNIHFTFFLLIFWNRNTEGSGYIYLHWK